MGPRITEYVKTKAVDQAIVHDKFDLSPLQLLQSREWRERSLVAVGASLAQLSCRGMIYTARGDIGSGLQDLGTPRVIITERNGELTGVTAPEHHGEELAYLSSFPVTAESA